ncbi:hypothetical protein HVPorG_04758 (plasmid) [Roseomonas mucosa]|nr:hypothetical protein HVPorG_04758 [Roseomonas mucosa]UZO94197.1 Branched-chain amino acid transport ATP-binding protein livF [Roseomonas mucosa]
MFWYAEFQFAKVDIRRRTMASVGCPERHCCREDQEAGDQHAGRRKLEDGVGILPHHDIPLCPMLALARYRAECLL